MYFKEETAVRKSNDHFLYCIMSEQDDVDSSIVSPFPTPSLLSSSLSSKRKPGNIRVMHKADRLHDVTMLELPYKMPAAQIGRDSISAELIGYTTTTTHL